MKNKIRAILAEKGMKQLDLAKLLEMSPAHLSEKMNGKYEWNKGEIDIILSFSGKKYEEIFLTTSSANSNQRLNKSNRPRAS